MLPRAEILNRASNEPPVRAEGVDIENFPENFYRSLICVVDRPLPVKRDLHVPNRSAGAAKSKRLTPRIHYGGQPYRLPDSRKRERNRKANDYPAFR
ncbi:hypothetical protein J4730_14860 [Klebsiella pneumoniae]|uniref:Uncharacterized protein n=1 Tax=Klebsiella pneumoniae TaxID=573 RepID=A0A939SSZ0_KLEPN|nr:hypothetical protein [Klebsiella pneumoniae]